MIIDADLVASGLKLNGLSVDDADLMEMYIMAAQGEVEMYLGRPVEVREFTENLWPDVHGAIYFSATPVVSVSEVIVNGQPKSADHFTVTEYGLENVWAQSWEYVSPRPNEIYTDAIYGPQVTVTYCAGLDSPPAIKGLVLQAVMKKWRDRDRDAARAQSEAMGVRRIEVEDFRVEYEPSTQGSRSTGASNLSMFESAFDLQMIARYRRRNFG